MKCPFCAHLGDKVVDSRESKEGEVIRRRRECLDCGRRFTSYERIDEIPYMVIKKDGTRERFERQKLIAGLLKACEKRPVSVAAVEGVADRLESMLQERPEKEMSTVEVGEVTITAVATPGHRPEHMAYLIADESRGREPWLVTTGDSLFVGDVARPDLAVEPHEGARELRKSMHRLLELDDFAEVWPGHIGGSLCGGAGMSEKPGTTIGFERRFNRLLKLDGEDAFVDPQGCRAAITRSQQAFTEELNRQRAEAKGVKR